MSAAIPSWAIPKSPQEALWDRHHTRLIRRAAARGLAVRRRWRASITGADAELLIGAGVELLVKDASPWLEILAPQRLPAVEDLLCFEKPTAIHIGMPPNWRFQDPPTGRATRILMQDGARLAMSHNSCIAPGGYVTVGSGARFEMRESSYLGHDCNVNCRAGITVGRGTLIGQQTAIMDYDGHPVFPVGRMPKGKTYGGALERIRIGDNVWIGFRSIILKGVSIGDGAIIGSGSVVSADIPPNCVAAGNPARVVRRGVTWKRY
jgi:acetyltransferase-like isoleucine patch superfamily enzyme